MSHHRRSRITRAGVAAVLAIPLALSAGPAGAAQQRPGGRYRAAGLPHAHGPRRAAGPPGTS